MSRNRITRNEVSVRNDDWSQLFGGDLYLISFRLLMIVLDFTSLPSFYILISLGNSRPR